MADTTSPGNRLDPFGLAPAMGGLMNDWAAAWQAVALERGLPAARAMTPAAWIADGGKGMLAALEGWLGTPEWADLPSVDGKALARLAPSAEFADLARDYTIAAARLWIELCQTFQTRLAEREGATPTVREALEIWNEVLDREVMGFNRSETFGELQRRFVRALMAQKVEIRGMAAKVAEQFDLPTRTEVDEITRRVHALERENRRLRRRLGTGQDLVPQEGEA